MKPSQQLCDKLLAHVQASVAIRWLDLFHAQLDAEGGLPGDTYLAVVHLLKAGTICMSRVRLSAVLYHPSTNKEALDTVIHNMKAGASNGTLA